MSTVQEIEAAIQTLPLAEQANLFARMEERHAFEVDRFFEEHLQTGAFDDRIADAINGHTSGLTRSL